MKKFRHFRNIYRSNNMSGIIGVICGVLLILISVISFLSGAARAGGGLIFTGGMLFAGILLLKNGKKVLSRNSRISAYLAALAGRNRISVEELCQATGFTREFIYKDLNEIIRLNLIPTGRFAANGAYFKIGQMDDDELGVPLSEEDGGNPPKDINFTEEGRSYIAAMRKTGATLISGWFYERELEEAAAAAEKVYRYIEEYPGKLPAIKTDINRNIRRASEYLSAYRELARLSIDSRRINELKNGIVHSLSKGAGDFNELYKALTESAKKEEKGEIVIEGKGAEEVIIAGKAYLKRIMRAVAVFNDEKLNSQAEKMNSTLTSLFTYLESHEDKAAELKRLMNRHFPLLLKLLESYSELGKYKLKDEMGEPLRKDVTSAMDAVNKALENIHDNIGRGAALDISTDIDVLKTILKQDGLLREDDFKTK